MTTPEQQQDSQTSSLISKGAIDMKEVTHCVLTQAEAKTFIRRVVSFFHVSGPMTVMLTGAGIVAGGHIATVIASALSATPLLYGAAAVIGAVVGGFLGWSLGALMPLDVNEGFPDPLERLEAHDLDQLQRIAQTVPAVQFWVRQALDAKLTFRQRDLDAARRDERKWKAALDRHVADVNLDESTGRLKKAVDKSSTTTLLPRNTDRN